MVSAQPKILVVTQFSPNASGGGPAIIRQALKEYDGKQIGWWSCFPNESPFFGFRLAFEAGLQIPKKLYPHKRGVAAKGWLLEHIWSPLARASIERAVKAWKPDLLWVIPHMWAIFPVSSCLRLSCKEVPYHVSVQDYMDMSANVPILGRDRGKRMASLVYEICAKSNSQDASSLGMLEDLQNVTGRSGAQTLHCGLEPEDFDFIQTAAVSEDNVIRVAYAGTIQVQEVFSSVVEVFARVNSRPAGPRIAIDFFGSHSYAKQSWFRKEWMREHGNMDEQALRIALRKCSIGFAPMGMRDDIRYNRFSFPTKFISYLAAGLPVLTVGHPEASAVRMAHEYSTGFCWDSPDLDAMAKGLTAWLGAADLKSRYAQNILACARAHFDAKKMRSRLYACFQNCIRADNSL